MGELVNNAAPNAPVPPCSGHGLVMARQYTHLHGDKESIQHTGSGLENLRVAQLHRDCSDCVLIYQVLGVSYPLLRHRFIYLFPDTNTDTLFSYSTRPLSELGCLIISHRQTTLNKVDAVERLNRTGSPEVIL